MQVLPKILMEIRNEPKIKDLLDNVNGVYPGTVMTRVNGETGELHIDQVSQEI